MPDLQKLEKSAVYLAGVALAADESVAGAEDHIRTLRQAVEHEESRLPALQADAVEKRAAAEAAAAELAEARAAEAPIPGADTSAAAGAAEGVASTRKG